jgi:hypothetical protein
VPLSNLEVVTIAVYLLGGEHTPIDTEHVAVKANELAPGKFTWRLYTNQIHLDNVRISLVDARKPDRAYLCGSDRSGWSLTDKGIEFVQNHLAPVGGGHKPVLSPAEHRWRRHERERLLAHEAKKRLGEGGVGSISRQDVESFFGVDDYVQGDARRRRVGRILGAFGDDPELGSTVKELAGALSDG